MLVASVTRVRTAAAIWAATSLCVGMVVGCAPARPQPARAATSRPTTTEVGAQSEPLARYHSKRLGVSLPLPEGKEWRIDDHSSPELVATHPQTHSRLVVAVIRTDAVVGRTECERLARAHKLVPVGDLRTLEDAVTTTQESFDTRIWVAIQPGIGADESVVGHVMAFGGFLRKCYVFGYSTVVNGAAEEPILSSRLALARTRILGGFQLALPTGGAGSVPRTAPRGPESTQAH
ncbi:MAG: hypothetical protein M3O50_19755 [Myxococcota bacterium]|nr:hypothetical protein [Myxococcota bacterium]